MADHASLRDWRKQTLALALTLVVIGTTVPAAFPAASATSAEIKAIPHESRQDVGTFINLQMKFSLETGNPITEFLVTLDPGTSSQKVLKFNTQGTILPGSDSIFNGVSGQIKFKSDGYYGQVSVTGMFMTKLIKSMLSVGTHNVSFEIKSGSNTLASDSTDFILKAAPPARQANLQALALFGQESGKNGHQTVHAIAIEKNNGTKSTGGFEAALYISKSPVLDSSATLIRQKHAGGLAPGDINAIEFNGNISVEPGTYYLIVFLDSTNVVNETHENDNTHSVKLVVQDPVDKHNGGHGNNGSDE